MEITTVNGRQVVKCPHCNGSSGCQFGTIVKRIDFDKPLHDAAKQQGIAYGLECETCGRGTKQETPDALKQPVCKVCSGKGYSIVS
jgi:DNA-directed RNA polymerase subunit RPC12/RpoP